MAIAKYILKPTDGACQKCNVLVEAPFK